MQPIDTLLEEMSSGWTGNSDEACRLFHGRGQCFEGLEHLCVDWLPPYLLVTCFAPMASAWEVRLIAACAERFSEARGLLIQDRFLPGAPLRACFGDTPAVHQVKEQGLQYQLRLGRNQNTGLFLDMAEGRRWVRQHAKGARVLNLFAYTCAFSVAAMAGGARSVVNLDMSRGALEQGRENHRLNDLDLRAVQFLAHDLFRSWGKLRRQGPYDLVVIDPPSFQKGSFVATKDYQRVLRRLPELMAPGAQVLACLNDPAIGPDFLIQQMAELCPDCHFEERLPNPSGFPERHPEKGLKVLRFRYAEG